MEYYEQNLANTLPLDARDEVFRERARMGKYTQRSALERQSRSETMDYVWLSPLDKCFVKLILFFHVICQMFILYWKANSAKAGTHLLNGSLNGKVARTLAISSQNAQCIFQLSPALVI